MDTSVVALIGIIIGALAGLVGGFLTGRQQSKLEYQKWVRAREDDYNKEVRLAVAELGRKMAAATHSMNWIAWRANKRPAQFTAKDIDAYDQEMHALLPDIASSILIVSALSESMYNNVKSLVQEVYNLDLEIAAAASSFQDSPQQTTAVLGAFKEQTWKFNTELTQKVTNIISNTSNLAPPKLPTG